MATSKFSTSNWKKGQVSLFQALGITKGTVTYPKLQATLPGAVATSEGGNTGSTAPPGTAPTNAPTYTQGQLQQLWIQAGGNPAYSLIASAIAMAESSGRSGAIDNDSNGTQDQGLWQINSSHGLSNMFNPLANARAAISISSNGTNWEPWVTYQTGAYEQFM
jgi:Lysozyme like domain